LGGFLPFQVSEVEFKHAFLLSMQIFLKQPPYENPEYFYRHVEMHSLCVDVPAGDYEFPIRCGWKGTSFNMIYLKIIDQKGLSLKITCPHSADCEATAKGRPKLREHLRSHTQEKVVACPGCGGMYANNTKFFDHIIRQSDMEGKVHVRKLNNKVHNRLQCYHLIMIALCVL